MVQGTVEWFSDDKGYGFVVADDGRTVYVHYSTIEGEGFTSLPEGAKVEFDVVEARRGPEAQRVRALE